jgi:UDPglucose 6-dehydrogenase
MKKVAMIGVGKLGQDCAEVMAKHYDVVGYDVEPRTPAFPMCNSIEEAVKDRDLIFIAAPTPHDPIYGGETPTSHLPNKDFDYTIVKNILEEVNKHVNKQQLVVLISTVLPGTVRSLLHPCITNARFIYNPYLIAMGTVKWDMVNPEMVIIGTEDGSTTGDAFELIEFYKVFMENAPRYEIGTWDEAESIKIFYNTFISTKIALVNMIQDVAEANGNINVDVVTTALAKSTQRIMGPGYMVAGMGDGGACHPRDNIALRFLADRLNLGYDLFDAIMKAREVQAENLAKKCIANGNNITIIGKSYKPGVHYLNGSPSLLVGHYIEQLGGKVNYYDVHTGDTDLCQGWTDVYLIGYWDEYVKNIKFPIHTTVIDPWRKITSDDFYGDIVHYGDTRKKKIIKPDDSYNSELYKNTYILWPSLLEFQDKIHIIYACTQTEVAFIKRSFEDVIEEINLAFSQGKTKIIFFNTPETLLRHEVLKCQRIVEFYKDAPAHTFFFTLSTVDAESDYERIVSTRESPNRLTILAANNFEYIVTKFNVPKEPIYKIQLKEKKFLCFNKIPRGHRVILLGKLLPTGLVDQSFYSFEGKPEFYDLSNTSYWDMYDTETRTVLHENFHRLPLKLNITHDRPNPVDVTSEDMAYHENSYFSVITETIFHKQSNLSSQLAYDSYKFITEKTYRTILLKHPFIIVGWVGIIDMLKTFGYKTFSPYINEDYDTIEDDDLRMDAIVKEIERLCSMTDSQWLEWQKNIKPILDYNYQVLVNKKEYNLTKNIDDFFKN